MLFAHVDTWLAHAFRALFANNLMCLFVAVVVVVAAAVCMLGPAKPDIDILCLNLQEATHDEQQLSHILRNRPLPGDLGPILPKTPDLQSYPKPTET